MRILFLCIFVYVVILMTSFTVMAGDSNHDPHKKALLAGGCFWCVESDLGKQDGVVDVISGYAGGDRPNPTYDNYYKLTDGYKIPHLEVVEVLYDPAVISFRDIVQYHFENIDPTDGEGQFADRGTHYRPAVFYANDEEKAIIEDISKSTEDKIKKPVKVDILPMAPFYAAEDYHQDYAEKNKLRYKMYRTGSGRDQKIQDIWGPSSK